MFSAQDDASAGIPVVHEAYPDGEAGIQKSLRVICQKVSEGAKTSVMKSYAGNVLKQAGFPSSTKERAAALLLHVRSHVCYAPDALGTEQIQSAAVSLCVEGAPVCIPIGDCDDLTVALATLCAAAGMEVEIVRQFFGVSDQQHVMCEVKLENGQWFPIDPSSSKLLPGEKARATRETRCNPWNGAGLSSGGEFVGIGGLPVFVLTERGWARAPTEATLGADRDGRLWYPVSPGVEASMRPVRTWGIGAEPGLLTRLRDEVGLGRMLPELTTGVAVVAGVAVVLGSIAVAVVVRKSKD